MLNNRKVFKRLMALLRKIDPKKPLPPELDDYLWKNMEVEDYCFKLKDLETEGKVPGKAYYVVRGFVIVYGFDEKLNRYVFRIYKENSIVALNSFMEQTVSTFTIVACKDTLVWSITDEEMQNIYGKMDGMHNVALKAALQYSDLQEEARAVLLALEVDERVMEFYKRYKGLLPPKHSPIRDACIACFLGIDRNLLRRTRKRLRL
jgi:CRP-like cAMP-binding protein